MKTIVIAAAVAALAGAAAPAFAQTLTAPQGYGGIGYTGLDPNGHDLGEITGRLGLKFSPYWGVETEIGTGVSNSKFTNAAGNPATLSEQPSIAGFAVGYYPVTPKFDLLARVGYGETDLRIVDAAGRHENTSPEIAYGAGAQYFLTSEDGIRVDYTRRDFSEASAPKDMDTWQVGYVRKF
jgi:opacity protein-like surface antigen